MAKGTVAVISGSASDRQVVDGIIDILKEFGVEYDVKILSAHRNPSELKKYIENSEADVFVAVAGMAAHLAGVIASLTVKPVIGVPVSGKLGGLDALLSMVQMPTGVPVATVAIDGGKNAAILAVEVLALKESELKKKILGYRKKMAGT